MNHKKQQEKTGTACPTEVAAVILERDGRILICRRGPGGDCGFLWEFPGGKREEGETMEACALRECGEELGVEVKLTGIRKRLRWSYPSREMEFTFFEGYIQSGELTPRVHSEVVWALPQELPGYTFCPADVGLVEELVSERS